MSLLRDAIILDTETLGLTRGAGIHELAYYDFANKKVIQYLLNPNSTKVYNTAPQDAAKLSSGQEDFYQKRSVTSWMDALVQETMDRYNWDRETAEKNLDWSNEWLINMIKAGQAPHLENKVENNLARTELFKRFGIQFETRGTQEIEQVLKDLPDAFRGKTIWIANAPFESKQIGAKLGVMGDNEALEFKQRMGLETYSDWMPEPFYVTGQKVNQARTYAHITGDWTKVYQAYRDNTPKANETAVRDIQDVLRAVMSYGKQLNLFEGGSHYFGTGIEDTHKLMAQVLKDNDRIGMKELHRAAEDAALHESYVLENSLRWAEALDHVQRGTAEGLQIMQMAKQGKGELAETAEYFRLLQEEAPRIMRRNLLKRMSRAYEDIKKDGFTIQTTGAKAFKNLSQLTPDGEPLIITAAEQGYKRMGDMDQVYNHLQTEAVGYEKFGISVEEEYQKFSKASSSLQDMNHYVNNELANLEQMQLKPVANRLGNFDFSQSLRKSFAGIKAPAAGSVLTGMMAVAAVGAAWSVVQERPKEQSSILGFTYYDWLKGQEGMAAQGAAKATRSKDTDFGSPYQGPVVSNAVLQDQQILAEREKWLRKQYGATHYDPLNGLFGVTSVFKFRNGYNFVHSGNAVPAGTNGMQGQNLVKLNLKDGWKMSVEDADTVTLRQGGLVNGIMDFFGFGKSYSFRLAGIDAPEIAHADRSAQPFAEEAKAGLRNMVESGGQVELIYDPTNLTYGRMMAGLVVDGKNLNYELVKRGMVGHLPYGKQENSIVDYAAMKSAEQKAYKANKGVWGTNWGKAIYNLAQSEDRPTFNTLVNPSKVVQSSSLMNMYSLSNMAQNDPTYMPLQEEIERTNKTFNSKDDFTGRQYFDNSNYHLNYMNEMLSDVGRFTKTHGKEHQNEFSSRNGYGQLNSYLALDSMNTTNSVWTRRRYGVFENYNTDKRLNEERKERMAAQQRFVNQHMFISPINHYRM